MSRGPWACPILSSRAKSSRRGSSSSRRSCRRQTSSDRVLFGHFGLDALDEAHHFVLPLAGVAQALIANFVKNIVEVVEGLDDFADVGFLKIQQRRHLKGVDLDAQPSPFGSPLMPETLLSL